MNELINRKFFYWYKKESNIKMIKYIGEKLSQFQSTDIMKAYIMYNSYFDVINTDITYFGTVNVDIIIIK